jgi:hypothetical protein
LHATNNFEERVNVLQNQNVNTVKFDLLESAVTIISLMNTMGQGLTKEIAITAFDQSVNVNLPDDFHGIYFANKLFKRETSSENFIGNNVIIYVLDPIRKSCFFYFFLIFKNWFQICARHDVRLLNWITFFKLIRLFN